MADRADPLGQPTRARLFEMLRGADAPLGTAELAARTGLHPNGVRLHLERLRGAGLLDRVRVPQPRGRPRAGWVVAADARTAPRATVPDAALGAWLARAIAPDEAGIESVEAVGREIGREMGAVEPEPEPESAMRQAVARLGFEPHRDASADGLVRYVLARCPYRDAVRSNAAVVCGLHRGITKGLLDAIAPGATLETFVPHDPDRVGCVIEIGGL